MMTDSNEPSDDERTRYASVQEGLVSTAPGPVGIGTLINNNYLITNVLKSGGMGAVYRGIEIGTGDPVAIKAVLPQLAEDEKAAQLFRREARMLRQLADDAIVRYYNYVHDLTLDRYFLIMEFIEGQTLSEYLERHGPVAPGPARTLMARLAQGLAKAHQQGVVHRDLSPDNVMLVNGSMEQGRLIDFGIAQSQIVTDGTMHGQFAGKFKYVAPEQLGHFDGVISPATDIYGLALLIAAATIGTHLDMGDSIVAAVEARQSVPDLSAVPAELRPLLSMMLEPDPAARPLSMTEVLRLMNNPHLIVDGNEFAPSAAVPITSHVFHSEMAAGIGTGIAHKRRWGSGIVAAALWAFLALVGGGLAVERYRGIWGGDNTVEQEAQSVVSGIPNPDISTRDGFLSASITGDCAYAARINSGPNAGLIEAFSVADVAFDGLPAAYEKKFGTPPEVLLRQVSPEQCAALNLVRRLQGRGRPTVEMSLSTDSIQSGEAVDARIITAGDQAVWTVLISPTGAVYNLTDRLSAPVGGHRSLTVGLTLAPDAMATPQLLLSVATQRPLTRAAVMLDGVQAAELLPSILEEVAARGGAATASLSYVLLTPADPP